MIGNWSAIIGTLLFALAGALAFVAYRNPIAFRDNLGIPLAVLTALAFIVLSFWNLGALHAQSEALLTAVKSQDKPALETVSALAQKIRDTYLLELYGLLTTVAVIAYLLLLSRLPQLGLTRPTLEKAGEQPVSSEPISSDSNPPKESR